MSMTTGRYLPASFEGEPTADLEALSHFFQMTVTSRLLRVERADECRMLEIEQSLATTGHLVTHSATTDHETRLPQLVCGQLVRYNEAWGDSRSVCLFVCGVALGRRGVTGLLREALANHRKEPQPHRDHKRATFVCLTIRLSVVDDTSCCSRALLQRLRVAR